VKSLATGGRLVTCGATTATTRNLICDFVYAAAFDHGSYMGTKSECARAELVAQGRLKPTVDKVFDLGDCIAAHNYLEKAKQFGKWCCG